ncbi:MAG: ABC transporter permease [Vicinamibacterales bacterium]
MHEHDWQYWQRLVAARSAAAGHPLSDDVVTELAMFLADVYQAERAAGQTPEAAHAAALQRLDRAAFDDVAQRQRASRPPAAAEARPIGASEPWLSSLWYDLRAAASALMAARAFTTTAVFTMAAGLALATAILAAVNVYMLRGLPYPDADRLYGIDYGPFPWPEGIDRLDWSSLDDTVELTVAWDLDGFHILGGEYPESAQGTWATPGFMQAMDVRASVGRTFTLDEYREGGPNVAMISHRLWQTRFGGRPEIAGSTFTAYLNDRADAASTFTIVGVLPADLWLMNTFSDVVAPLKGPSAPYQLRLRPGVAPDLVASRIDTLIRRGATGISPQFAVRLESLQDGYVAQVRPTLWSIAVGAGLVVLIAAANVAILMIVRARGRVRELAVRIALGASHLRIARMVTLEGLLIGALSTGIGLATAAALLPSLGPFVERSLNRRIPGGLSALSLDPAVLLVGLAAGAAVTALFTLIPVAMLWRSRASLAVAGSLRGIAGTPGTGRSRAALIALEVAASLTLLAGAALMADSARRMLQVDFGVDGRDVTTAMLSVRRSAFPDAGARAGLYERLDRELTGVAGNTAVALGSYWPLQTPPATRVGTAQATAADASSLAVTTRYFEAVGMRVLEGRPFAAADRLGAEPVMIISASLARHLWPGASALGQSLSVEPAGDRPLTQATVIGVVNDVRQTHLDQELHDTYVPLAQNPIPFTFLYLRGPLHASWDREVRATLARVHPEISIGTVRPLEFGLEQERARPRFLAYLLSTFAIVASLLALIGMHGVIAYAVRQRQREIAVRIAVGADPRAVTLLFLRYGAWVLGAGVVLGLGGALGLGQVLQSQLHGVRPAEPAVLIIAVAAFTAVAFLAMLWPARRAAAVDPLAVLKDE